MGISREQANAFVEGYGQAWGSWDIPGFLGLFSDDVVYVAHATQETVVGSAALDTYLRKEAAEQGDVSVRMGEPLVDGDRVAAEFWVLATPPGGTATIAGCLIGRLTPDGRCDRFREYWFDIEGHTAAFDGWGE